MTKIEELALSVSGPNERANAILMNVADRVDEDVFERVCQVLRESGRTSGQVCALLDSFEADNAIRDFIRHCVGRAHEGREQGESDPQMEAVDACGPLPSWQDPQSGEQGAPEKSTEDSEDLTPQQ